MQPRPTEPLVADLRTLANYVCRRLRYYEAIGEAQPGELLPEELVDLVYLEAGAHLRERPPGEPGYRWLRSLADRVLARAIRRLRAERRALGDDAQLAITRSLPELLPDPNGPVQERIAEAAELQRALARLVGELPDELREPFLLVEVDGHNLDDVAALEDLPRHVVTKRVAEAARRLRDRLAELYGDDAPSPEYLLTLLERLPPVSVGATTTRAP